MSDDDALLVLGFGLLYRIVVLFVGLAFVYMGYRLFLAGVFEKAGDLEAKWGNNGLIVKQAAPGTLFALFGTIIVCVSLINPADFSHQTSPDNPLPQERDPKPRKTGKTAKTSIRVDARPPKRMLSKR